MKINSRLQKEVYESKKARDILDKEFTEFLSIKRNTNEFFDLYNRKFYNIDLKFHNLFIKKSLHYIVDYTNPKQIQYKILYDQLISLQIEIGSIEGFHPIFKNNTVLHNTTDSNSNWYIIQSGKRRQIVGGRGPLLDYIKQSLGKKEIIGDKWAIAVSSDTISNITGGPSIIVEEDLYTHLYTINTGKALPSNIYIG
tara:strand:- start:1972 stop:2562 length:591 start_codon:yes stop_codon:yes gene_type:complete